MTTLVDELYLHRQAVQEMRDRCAESDTWVCSEALLYVVDTNEIVERMAIWTFPSDVKRVLKSMASDEWYIWARLRGTNRFEKVFFGVSCTSAGIYERPFSNHDGELVQIISFEKEDEPLQLTAELTLISFKQAEQMSKVHAVAKEAKECAEVKQTFPVLRTSEYLIAQEIVHMMDSTAEDVALAMKVLDDPKGHCWALTKKLEEMGRVGFDLLNVACASMASSGGNVCVYDNIWLVEEKMVPTSIQKSSACNVWDPVLMYNEHDRPSFHLVNLS